jgi:hypothetical protein
MKIAIQGHPTRGKEIIQILESLGGKKLYYLNASDKCLLFFIDDKEYISCIHHESPLVKECFKIYTLEEFEKEFPFKVGDKVIHKEFNDFFEVISFNPGSSYPYKIKGVCEFNTKSHVLTKWQPKMKEERFVTLTLDKAKEWYRKGGELKEIALQAFTEKELIVLPKSWEEFCEKYPVKDKEAHIDSVSNIIIQRGDATLRSSTRDRNICPSKESAEAHLAMIQLEQLRNCWWGDWKPEWNAGHKYAIKNTQSEITIIGCSNVAAFLVFPTREMAEEFLRCFRDLIEKAGDLI